MSKKILVLNNPHYNHSAATLIEGLIENKEEYDLELYMTTPFNYATVKGKWDHVVYSKDVVEKLIDKCDVVVTVCDHFTPVLVPREVKKEKGVYLDSNDYHDYLDSPINYKFYLKREMRVDKEHLENTYPFWFGAEKRYFFGGVDFEEMWSKKKTSLSFLAGLDDQKPWRGEISEILKWSYSDREDFILDPVYGGTDDSGIDTGGRHWSNFFNTLLDSKVSVDSYGAGLANNNGRIFESLANGCALFYPSIWIHSANPFTDGENIMIYNSSANLIEKINDIIDDDKKLKDIAYAGFNHMLNYHTTKRRGMEFLELCKGYNLI
ncbi:glycosyltransferase family 1 protein [candidate division WWE3 bacterium]|mgnify:CR=1 FL=1|jgi:hypothetical protein|nr:glycosyltransferase family 1 protein [candidate division WWE3 bacterium]